jgi:cell division FtsZ-interacting protein ZapD
MVQRLVLGGYTVQKDVPLTTQWLHDPQQTKNHAIFE